MPTSADIAMGLGVADASGIVTFVAVASQVNATPPVYEMGAGEELAVSFEFDAVMVNDEVPDDTIDPPATVELLDLIAGESYTDGLTGAISVNAATVNTTIGGLVAGREYRATVEITTDAGNTYEAGLRITCPY